MLHGYSVDGEYEIACTINVVTYGVNDIALSCADSMILGINREKKISAKVTPEYATNNGHMFYIVCRSLVERTRLIALLKENGIYAAFHYLSLHLSDYYREHHVGEIPNLPNCDRFADCLVRLPMYFELKEEEVLKVIECIKSYYQIL